MFGEVRFLAFNHGGSIYSIEMGNNYKVDSVSMPATLIPTEPVLRILVWYLGPRILCHVKQITANVFGTGVKVNVLSSGVG